VDPFGFVTMTSTELIQASRPHSHSREISWAWQFLPHAPRIVGLAATIKRLHVLVDRLAFVGTF
jgi:hypothetical protein